MSYMIKLINMACDAAPDGARITSLTAEVGELTGVLPEYLKKYFPTASKGTPCEGADFNVTVLPAEAECHGCGTRYHPSRDNDYKCPGCGSIDSHFLHGREISVKEISVETQ